MGPKKRDPGDQGTRLTTVAVPDHRRHLLSVRTLDTIYAVPTDADKGEGNPAQQAAFLRLLLGYVSVLLNHVDPELESEIVLFRVADQVRSEFSVVPLFQHCEVEGYDPGEVLDVLSVSLRCCVRAWSMPDHRDRAQIAGGVGTSEGTFR
jgi:hypothetical protein